VEAVESRRGGGVRARGRVCHAHQVALPRREVAGHRVVRGARVRGHQQGPDAAHLRRRVPRQVTTHATCLFDCLLNRFSWVIAFAFWSSWKCFGYGLLGGLDPGFDAYLQQ
jgi:hypothetical protein